ncbi:hypothetical protein KY284_030086 [Solanum tuberosum]|nr:hypothetical protein KY284_030086 [Solanum tuberosum]
MSIGAPTQGNSQHSNRGGECCELRGTKEQHDLGPSGNQEEVDGVILELEENYEVVEESISLNALSGSKGLNTIQLNRKSKRNKATILLDSGNTHNFLDLETAKKMGCVISEARAMRVTVADDNHIMRFSQITEAGRLLTKRKEWSSRLQNIKNHKECIWRLQQFYTTFQMCLPSPIHFLLEGIITTSFP